MIEWFDDVHVGTRFKTAEKLVTREDIKRFAAEFDPQPYHLDEAAAEQSMLKGLAVPVGTRQQCPCGLRLRRIRSGRIHSWALVLMSCAGWRRCGRAT
jgi:hypothetical protein